MSEKENSSVKETITAISKAANMENIQKYVLGTKKNGAPRAIYDVVKDMTKISVKTKKKKKKKHDFEDEFALYLGPKKKKKKKKGKKGKKNKYWRYDD